jgi:hypothetical protein
MMWREPPNFFEKALFAKGRREMAPVKFSWCRLGGPGAPRG